MKLLGLLMVRMTMRIEYAEEAVSCCEKQDGMNLLFC